MKRVGALPREEWTTRGDSELPHVFLKHKNAKTYMQTKGNRDTRWKKSRQLQGEGRCGISGGGARGSLQAQRHINGERRVMLTRSLTECSVQLLLCVFSTIPPSDPRALLHVLFFCGWLIWLKFIILTEGFKKVWRAEQLSTIKFSILPSIWNSEWLETEIFQRISKMYFQTVERKHIPY